MENLKNLKLYELADIIIKDWKKPYFGAGPYLAAMGTMNNVNDNYGADSGHSIVIYFLSNAATWKGPLAKIVKQELKNRIK